jgi:nucleotide-binding universal stress UspA family protein
MILPKVDVKKILYATDLSENARYAYAYARSLADLYQATMTIIHILPEIPDMLDKQVIGYIDADRWEKIKAQHFDEVKDEIIDRQKDLMAVKDVLHQFSRSMTGGPEADAAVVDDIIVDRGNPVEKIINYSEQENFDLIVMGTHGHGKLEDAMIGSTARRVVRRSEIPVLVVRLPKEED